MRMSRCAALLEPLCFGMRSAPAMLAPEDFLASLDVSSRQLGLFGHIVDISYFIKDRAGRYMAANEAFVHLMGYRRVGEILGCTDYELISPIMADACRMDDEQVLTTGETIINKVELVPQNVLSVGWFATTKLPLRDRSGRIVGVEGMTREFKAARGAAGPYPELSAVIDFVEQNYAQRFTVDDLARQAGMTVRTLERLFSRRFSMTPFGYVKRLRLNAACRMLAQSALPIAQVAVECGFCDQSYMTKEFGRVLRTTPQVYRDIHAL